MRFLILSYLALGLSCNGQNNAAKQARSDTVQIRERSWMAEFALPYTSDLMTDHNSLIFYYTHSFDTAISIHLKKESSFLSCVFYWIIPQNRFALRNFRNHENELTQFEGLSAKLDLVYWEKIIEQVGKKHFKLEAEDGYVGCCDIPYYFLSFNGRMYTNNNKLNSEQLKEVKTFLESSIIAKLRAMTQGR